MKNRVPNSNKKPWYVRFTEYWNLTKLGRITALLAIVVFLIGYKVSYSIFNVSLYPDALVYGLVSIEILLLIVYATVVGTKVAAINWKEKHEDFHND